MDVYTHSKECISSYRVRDGYKDCVDGEDGQYNRFIITKACLKIRRHRFQHSMEQPTYLLASSIGDGVVDCVNGHDEEWMRVGIKLSKDGCQFLCQYIKSSQELG